MSVRPLRQIKEFKYVIKTSNVTNTHAINILSQENEGYNNQHDQQLMTRKNDGGQGRHNQNIPQFIVQKHNGGVKQVNNELEPNSVLEEKEEWFYLWANNYDGWNNNPSVPTNRNEIGNSHTFYSDTSVFSPLTKPNITGNRKQEL